ncbi:MAG: hypothetical protein Q7T82_20885 [Armatimonadota bacterium]|nr:hypothetical protein [Armatimonadota bacterium]
MGESLTENRNNDRRRRRLLRRTISAALVCALLISCVASASSQQSQALGEQEAAARTATSDCAMKSLCSAIEGVEQSLPERSSPFPKIFMEMLLDAAFQGTFQYMQSKSYYSSTPKMSWGESVGMSFAQGTGGLLGSMAAGYRPQNLHNVLAAQTEEEIYASLLYELQRTAKVDPGLALSAAGHIKKDLWRVRAMCNIGQIALLNGRESDGIRALSEAVKSSEKCDSGGAKANIAKYVCYGAHRLFLVNPAAAKDLTTRCESLAKAASDKSAEGFGGRLWFAQASALTGLMSPKDGAKLFRAGLDRDAACVIAAGNLSSLNTDLAQAFLDEQAGKSYDAAGMDILARWAKASIDHARQRPGHELSDKMHTLFAEFSVQDPDRLRLVWNLMEDIMNDEPDLAKKIFGEKAMTQILQAVEKKVAQGKESRDQTGQGSLAHKIVMAGETRKMRKLIDQDRLFTWQLWEGIVQRLWLMNPAVVDAVRNEMRGGEFAVVTDAALLSPQVDEKTRDLAKARASLGLNDFILRHGQSMWSSYLGKHLAERMAASFPDSSQTILQRITDEDTKRDAYRRAAVIMADANPEKALDILEQSKLTGVEIDCAKRYVASMLIARNNPRSVGLFNDAYAATRGQGDLEERESAARDLATVVSWLGSTNPSGVEAVTGSLSSPYDKVQATRLLAASTIDTDPARAKTLLESVASDAARLGDADEKNQAICDLAATYSKLDPKRALDLAGNVTDPAKQAFALAVIAIRAKSSDAGMCARLLEQATSQFTKVSRPRQRAYVGYILARAHVGQKEDIDDLLANADAMYFAPAPW